GVSGLAGDSTITNVVAQSKNAVYRNAASERLQELIAITGVWDDLNVVDRNGIVLASSMSGVVGKPYTTDTGIEDVVHQAQGGTATSSDVLISPSSGKPTMIFAAPIRQANNPGQPVVATVVGSFTWSVIMDMMKSADVPIATLYNHTGKVIANKD